MKQKTPDIPSDEKKDPGFKTGGFQQEETPTKIFEDDEWFDNQRGKQKGFCQVVRGVPIEILEKSKESALSKEIGKSFTILGALYFQKHEADRLRKDMEDAIGAKKVLGLKKSQIAKDTGTSPFTDADVRQQVALGRQAASTGKTMTDLHEHTRPDTERIVENLMFSGLVDTFREKKFGEVHGIGDLFIKITDLGIQAYETIALKKNENDPLQYYYDVIIKSAKKQKFGNKHNKKRKKR